LKEQNIIIYSFRDNEMSRNEPSRDVGHFFSLRNCPGQSGTAGHPIYKPDVRGPRVGNRFFTYIHVSVGGKNSLRREDWSRATLYAEIKK